VSTQRSLTASEFGVELEGLNWEGVELSAQDKAAFLTAFDTHRLVLIRDCELSDEQQVALTEALGVVSSASPTMRQDQKLSYVSNTLDKGILRDGELLFHADFMFMERPLKAIALYALEVPAQGGETVFADASLAYQQLPTELKTRIAGLEARHVANYGAFDGSARPSFDPTAAKQLSFVHPVVWTHPKSGQPVLFVSPLLTESVVGMTHDDSEELLETLFGYIERAQYVHQWQVGDYLVWDNQALQHSRRVFDPTERRSLRRVAIAG